MDLNARKCLNALGIFESPAKYDAYVTYCDAPGLDPPACCPHEIAKAREWLNTQCDTRCGLRVRYVIAPSSAVLASQLHISEGALICAAVLEGYQCTIRQGGPSCYFDMRIRDARR